MGSKLRALLRDGARKELVPGCCEAERGSAAAQVKYEDN